MAVIKALAPRYRAPRTVGKETILADILVDARGHRCPVPTLRLRRACETAPPGSVLRLLADDPMAKIDVPRFATQAGLELLALTSDGDGVVARIRKPL